VSCYGKRSIRTLVRPSTELNSVEDEQEPSMEQKIQYEKYLEALISNCRLSDERSCATILKIMLTNTLN
jgi:hypothetical protein